MDNILALCRVDFMAQSFSQSRSVSQPPVVPWSMMECFHFHLDPHQRNAAH